MIRSDGILDRCPYDIFEVHLNDEIRLFVRLLTMLSEQTCGPWSSQGAFFRPCFESKQPWWDAYLVCITYYSNASSLLGRQRLCWPQCRPGFLVVACFIVWSTFLTWIMLLWGKSYTLLYEGGKNSHRQNDVSLAINNSAWDTKTVCC